MTQFSDARKEAVKIKSRSFLSRFTASIAYTETLQLQPRFNVFNIIFPSLTALLVFYVFCSIKRYTAIFSLLFIALASLRHSSPAVWGSSGLGYEDYHSKLTYLINGDLTLVFWFSLALCCFVYFSHRQQLQQHWLACLRFTSPFILLLAQLRVGFLSFSLFCFVYLYFYSFRHGNT